MASKRAKEPAQPTRRDIIEARVSINTSRPSGKAWYAAYKLDVKWLLEQIDALLAERAQT